MRKIYTVVFALMVLLSVTMSVVAEVIDPVQEPAPEPVKQLTCTLFHPTLASADPWAWLIDDGASK